MPLMWVIFLVIWATLDGLAFCDEGSPRALVILGC